MSQTAEDLRWQDLDIQAGQVFTPNTPVDERSVFAGRTEQIRRVVDAINQKGQHAIIFGERGVGKTSLANVLAQFLSYPLGPVVVSPRVNCDGTDTFATVWRKIFDQIEMTHVKQITGFMGQGTTSTYDTSYNASELIEAEATPDTVRRILTMMSQNALPIMIIDEFDRLPPEHRGAFADTVKSLSDHAVAATVVLVGVADTVEQLIEAHQSVARALVQIQMPRMAFEEIVSILKHGFGSLNITAAADAQEQIAALAQGMPHYAHLLGLHSSRVAIENRTTAISANTVQEAISRAIKDAAHSIRSAYVTATTSARKENLFGDVLLACALAGKDELGFFAAQDVRQPLRQITGKNRDIPAFVKHLADFSNVKRGMILTKTGQDRRHRYRFSDPLMQPFVFMQGLANEKISGNLSPLSGSNELSLPLWQSAAEPRE